MGLNWKLKQLNHIGRHTGMVKGRKPSLADIFAQFFRCFDGVAVLKGVKNKLSCNFFNLAGKE